VGPGSTASTGTAPRPTESDAGVVDVAGGSATRGRIGTVLGLVTAAGGLGAAVSAVCARSCRADETSIATLVDEVTML